MARIVNCGVGVDRDTLARLDRLRACLGESRAKIINRALIGQGIAGLEREYRSEIVRFHALANLHGLTWQAYAQNYAQVNARQTYPPTLDQLELTA